MRNERRIMERSKQQTGNGWQKQEINTKNRRPKTHRRNHTNIQTRKQANEQTDKQKTNKTKGSNKRSHNQQKTRSKQQSKQANVTKNNKQRNKQTYNYIHISTRKYRGEGGSRGSRECF